MAIAHCTKSATPDTDFISSWMGTNNPVYMRFFAEAYPAEALVHQLGAQIPWKHNCAILDKLKDPEPRV